jgi:putative intracellular protease/amidase
MAESAAYSSFRVVFVPLNLASGQALWSFIMCKRSYVLAILALTAVMMGVGATIVLTLPTSAALASPPKISAQETADTLAALKPPKRQRPLIAVIGANAGSETTDYLIPYGVLKRADVGDVIALATQNGPITMMPALKIMPDATITAFDVQHPEGADYVIVPAMHHDSDPASIAWIKSQASKGAIIVGICSGAKILGNAGLLDGRKATTHWYDAAKLRKRHPTMQYVADRRFVVDRGVATTTGVSASIPMSLALIEAIAGHSRAAEVARNLGVEHWDARHDGGAFRMSRDFALAAAGNTLAFWGHEKLGIAIEPGVDEVALALTADAWSRTYRSMVVTISKDKGSVRTLGGIVVVPDGVAAKATTETLLPNLGNELPAKALDSALAGIEARYGRKTLNFVALQLEYPVRSGGTAAQKSE